MPAKQEACTAIVTEITDKDKDVFEARIFDKNNNNATLYVPTAAVGDWKIRQTWIATSFGDRIRGY